MKPAAFEYLAPTSVSAAVDLLAGLAGQDARVLAGGQTLIPAMAMRLARPSHLIDINGIGELSDINVGHSSIRIGACVRHAAFHQRVTGEPIDALLTEVVRHIAHLPIRHRGTVCGSLANADPAAEWSLIAVSLDATLVVRSVRGEREVAAAKFFQGFMTTVLECDELLVALRLPAFSSRNTFGFAKFSRRAGDFAQAAALVVVESEGGRCARARIGVGGVESIPRRLTAAEGCLAGQQLSLDAIRGAAQAAATSVEPVEATEELRAYKRALVQGAVHRALAKSVESAHQALT